MKPLLYATFLAVFSLGFLQRYEMAPRGAILLGDALAGLLGLFAVLHLARSKEIRVSPFYVIVFTLLVIHIVLGAIAASVPEGTLVSGVRKYFKYIPLFLLPLVYRFSERDIRNLLVFFLCLAFVQVPIAVYQRFIEGAELSTGDVVRGTLETSSILSVFLISAIAVALAFFLRRRLPGPVFVLIAVALLIPVTMNETKASVILIPVAAAVAFLAARRRRLGFGSVLALFAGTAGVLGAFALVYGTFFESDRLAFLTDKQLFLWMVAPQTTGVATSEEQIGRVDAAIAPFVVLSGRPLELVMGVGIGNVSESALCTEFNGEHFDEYGTLQFISIANIIWELGLIGCVLVLILLGRVLQDAWRLRVRDDLIGTLAAGWCAAVVMYLISLFYKNVLFFDSVAFSFMFFSGVIASERMAVRFGERSAAAVRRPLADAVSRPLPAPAAPRPPARRATGIPAP